MSLAAPSTSQSLAVLAGLSNTRQDRQWPKVYDFKLCRTFLHVVWIKKTQACESHIRFACYSRMSEPECFFDLCNMQKSETQIIYLRPLPKAGIPVTMCDMSDKRKVVVLLHCSVLHAAVSAVMCSSSARTAHWKELIACYVRRTACTL